MKTLSILLILTISMSQSQDTDCEAGYQCLDNSDCQSYKVEREKLEKFPKESSDFQRILNNLRNLVCNKKLRKVCCKVEELVQEQKSNTESPSWIPSAGQCGSSGGDAAFIRGGQDTKLGEFPWMALVGSPNTSGVRWKCGGVLINKWYVLSAAHCEPVANYVRLGEWEVVDTNQFNVDTCSYYNEISKQKCRSSRNCNSYCNKKNGNIDCQKIGRRENCAPESQEIKVARVITHPEYNRTVNGLAINDVMLLKLSKVAEFNTYVQPICLPDLDLTNLLGEPGHNSLNFGKAIVAGWGRTYNSTADDTIDIVSTPVLQKLEVSVLSRQTCVKKYKNIGLDIEQDLSLKEHMCAGGEYGKDSCNGDSGGPLISRESRLSPYMLIGVVSGGTIYCGIGGPGIYNRISNYRQWIVENLV